VEIGAALIISGSAFVIGAICGDVWGVPGTGQHGLFVAGWVLMAIGIGAGVTDGLTRPARSRRMPAKPNKGGVPAPGGLESERRNLGAAVVSSHATIATQFATSASLDTQLVGLLAFFATAGAVFSSAKHALDAGRWILLTGVSVAGLACFLGITLPSDPKSGPLPKDFYDRFGGAPETGYLVEHLGQLNRAIADNIRALDQRRGALLSAVASLAVATAIYGVTRLWTAV
jgi:hypothetical protein